MMNFSKNLRFLRKQSKHSQQELANHLGYRSFTTIQKWEDGSSQPPYNVIQQIAKLYQVNVEEIMSNDLEKMNPINIPILGTVRGGEPILAIQNILGYENITLDESKGGNYFYLEVVGDSMKNARIMPGDILYVRQQNSLNSGDIGIILLDDEATVKRIIYKKDKMILQPENEDYQPLVLSDQDIRNRNVQILGKVIHNKIKY